MLSKGRVFDVEAQNILIKTNIAELKAPLSVHLYKDCNIRERFVTTPPDSQKDVSPDVSVVSSSFPSSASSFTTELDLDELEVHPNEQPKKKKSPSPSMNIEEGVNEELSESIIELETLSRSKEVDKLLLINEVIDGIGSESDDSLYSIFSEESQ
eukprot:gene15725-17655_t